jgi:hypothetical protein
MQTVLPTAAALRHTESCVFFNVEKMMKLPLHIKIVLLLAYVVLCTHLLVAAHQSDHAFGIDVSDTAALHQQAEAAFTTPVASGDTGS